MEPANTQNGSEDPQSADIVAQNIQTVADIISRREARVNQHQRFIEAFTRSIGRPRFLYINAACMVAWMTFNSGLFGKPLDEPPFFWMTTVLAIEATLVTGMVLISQNRQSQEADRRAHLDLQINLLAEQKISKILSVLEELVERSVPRHNDPEAKAMQQVADPEVLLTALEFAMEQATEQQEGAALPPDGPPEEDPPDGRDTAQTLPIGPAAPQGT